MNDWYLTSADCSIHFGRCKHWRTTEVNEDLVDLIMEFDGGKVLTVAVCKEEMNIIQGESR